MSTQSFDESLHPREQTGKFATKDVADAAGGLDALDSPAPAGDELPPIVVCTQCHHRTKVVSGQIVHDQRSGGGYIQRIAAGSPLCPAASTRDVPGHLDALIRQYEIADYATYSHVQEAEGMVAAALDSAQRSGYPDLPPEYASAILAAQLEDRLHAPISSGVPLTAVGALIGQAHAAGMPVDWPEQMAARGDYWHVHCLDNWNDGVTAEHLAALDSRGLAQTPDMALGLVGVDLDVADEWAAAHGDRELRPYLNRYLRWSGIGRYARAGVPVADVRLAYELDMEPGVAVTGLTRPDGTVERGPDAIREIAAYKASCNMSEDHARDGIRAGVTPKTFKAFGHTFEAHEIPALEQAGVPAKVARSLRTRGSSDLSAAAIARLNDAGVTTGADFKAWAKVADAGAAASEEETVSAVRKLARSGVPLDSAQRLRSQGIPPEVLRDLHAGGIDDWSAWQPALEPRAQGLSLGYDEQTQALRSVGRFAKAGGTREQLARAQRAGLPLAGVELYAKSTPEQLWASGAKNREAVMAEETRLHTQWGSQFAAEPKAWVATGPNDLDAPGA